VTRFRHVGRRKIIHPGADARGVAWLIIRSWHFCRPAWRHDAIDRGRDQPSLCAQRTDLDLCHVLQQMREIGARCSIGRKEVQIILGTRRNAFNRAKSVVPKSLAFTHA
jgi:hypothetical protein